MTAKDVFEMQAHFCQAMAHAARVEIIHALQQGPRAVNDLAQDMGLNQTALSRHLAILRTIGLVTAQRHGQENIYRLANPKVAAICEMMRQVLAETITHQTEIAAILAAQAEGNPSSTP